MRRQLLGTLFIWQCARLSHERLGDDRSDVFHGLADSERGKWVAAWLRALLGGGGPGGRESFASHDYQLVQSLTPKTPDPLTNPSPSDGAIRALVQEFDRELGDDSPPAESANIHGLILEQMLSYSVELGPRGQPRIVHGAETSRRTGAFYTPPAIVAILVDQTLGAAIHQTGPRTMRHGLPRLQVLDPACGGGAMLLGAFRLLRNWRARLPGGHRAHTENGVPGARLSPAAAIRLAREHLFGVDIDPQAVEATRQALVLDALADARPVSANARLRLAYAALDQLAANIQCADALVGLDCVMNGNAGMALDWQQAFPRAYSREPSGFDVVLGNPPWGQKQLRADPDLKQYLKRRFPSSAGIFDMFRPFVERGVQLTKPGGIWGMVLPDIVLLKNYEPTRRYLLENLAIEHIDWWGMAFAGATIDAATITGRRVEPTAKHVVRVAVHDRRRPLSHEFAQADFAANPRLAFNLHLTPAKRRVLDRLRMFPRLGDQFEVHEGVHSGNLRAKLFLPDAIDATCRPLLVGRDEIEPYHLRWNGNYLCASAFANRRPPSEYANLGRPHWHQQAKLLVRRTGDSLRSAVDIEGRYASNNFYLIFPRSPDDQASRLGLYGLCALLNSQAMTWLFRTVEPRHGRAFAEVKIKHLCEFPLPVGGRDEQGQAALDALGKRRADWAAKLAEARGVQAVRSAEAACARLDTRIDALVCQLLGLSQDELRA